ncbi:MAG: efflux RND transporter periplasmic adaptor subunit, partial [Burkholderiales bacterium]
MSEERHAELGIHPVSPDDAGELLKRRQVVRRTKVITVVVLVLLALGTVRTVYSRIATAKALQADTTE